MIGINHFDKTDFLDYIISKIDIIPDGDRVNYQHTHDKIFYDPESGRLTIESICKNEHGSSFGLNLIGYATIPTEWNNLLPDMLLNSPNWMDLEA
jgi:hypothetical protein